METEAVKNVCNSVVFDDLFRSISKDLYNFLYYKYGPDSHAEDIVQEAFTKLWQNCKKVSPEKARAYLFKVASNRTLNELARDKTRNQYAQQPPMSASGESPDFILEEKQFSHSLEEALSELSDDQRATLMLNRVEDKSHKEIAEMMGISRKTVEQRLYSALRILKDKLGDLPKF